MALTYRNTRNGRMVSMSEPGEILAKGEADAERASRPGTKKARREAEIIADTAQRNAVHVRHTLDKMDASTKWERYNPPADPGVSAPPGPLEPAVPRESEPKAADVRAWAQSHGIDVPQRGKLPTDVVDQYLAANASADG